MLIVLERLTELNSLTLYFGYETRLELNFIKDIYKKLLN